MKTLDELMYWMIHHPNPVTRAVYREIVAKRVENGQISESARNKAQSK